MSYQSFLVTRDDLDSYYTPKSGIYDLMINSINSNGYGQAIYNFISTDDNSLNSVNIWNSGTRSMGVYDPSTRIWYTESEAGPSLWGVTSQQGIDFLNGTYDINGLTKLKYCNGCSGGNGLPVPVITSFKERTQYLQELVTSYGTSDSYLFYDYAQPVRQNFFPAVLDPNTGSYVFKNYQGTNKSELQVAADTGIPRESISTSLSEAKPIIPITCNKVLLSYSTSYFNVCLGIEAEYEIDLNNTVIYQLNSCGEITADAGYYYNGETVFYFDGTTLNKIGPCPGGSNSLIQECCSGRQWIIEGIYTIGTVVYSKDFNPAICYQVIDNVSDSPTGVFSVVNWEGIDCKGCTSTYSGGCK